MRHNRSGATDKLRQQASERPCLPPDRRIGVGSPITIMQPTVVKGVGSPDSCWHTRITNSSSATLSHS